MVPLTAGVGQRSHHDMSQMMSPYDRGYQAGLAGANVHNNPYHILSEDYAEWMMGYSDGLADQDSAKL